LLQFWVNGQTPLGAPACVVYAKISSLNFYRRKKVDSTQITDIQDALIDKEVFSLYEQVIDTCNKILAHANVFGFSLMHVPDPNIHSIVIVLEGAVIPLLDMLVKSGDFSPESGIRIANIKQYTLHIREIVLALEQEDKIKFNRAVSLLKSESMLFC
jgi:hypothetical protein